MRPSGHIVSSSAHKPGGGAAVLQFHTGRQSLANPCIAARRLPNDLEAQAPGAAIPLGLRKPPQSLPRSPLCYDPTAAVSRLLRRTRSIQRAYLGCSVVHDLVASRREAPGPERVPAWLGPASLVPAPSQPGRTSPPDFHLAVISAETHRQQKEDSLSENPRQFPRAVPIARARSRAGAIADEADALRSPLQSPCVAPPLRPAAPRSRP